MFSSSTENRNSGTHMSIFLIGVRVKFSKQNPGSRSMVQWTQCCLHKSKDWSWDPRSNHGNTHLEVQGSYNKTESKDRRLSGGSWTRWPGLQPSKKYKERHYPKQGERWGWITEDFPQPPHIRSGTHPDTCTNSSIHMYVQHNISKGFEWVNKAL